jgi:hypothetical protein
VTIATRPSKRIVIDKYLLFPVLHSEAREGDMPDIGQLTQVGNRPIEVEGPDSAAKDTLADHRPADEQRTLLQLDDQREILAPTGKEQRVV